MNIPLLAFAILFSVPVHAYDPAGQAAGNDLYKKGDYQAALEVYGKFAAAQPGSPWAFYNMGNAWFRLDRNGLALLNYARAFRLAPRDADIRANLEFVLKRSGQIFVPEGVPRALHYLYYFLSDRELSAAAAALWWLACALLSVSFLRPALRGKLGGLAAGCGLMLALSLLWLAARSSGPFSGAAVITAEGSVPLMSGPGHNFKTYAALPEARLVKVLDDTDAAYYEVGIPSEGIKGWIRKTAVERI